MVSANLIIAVNRKNAELEARVVVLERERVAILDRAEKTATVRVDCPLEAFDIVDQAMVNLTRETSKAWARVAVLERRLGKYECVEHEEPTVDVCEVCDGLWQDEGGRNVEP